ncbi:hypothetical protein [Arthrobacter sp. 92]|uniref:hypothetical protein n=1 Tax=Arthrobacter sp. 92 TaxID=3418175 RepID=UPI003D00A42C
MFKKAVFKKTVAIALPLAVILTAAACAPSMPGPAGPATSESTPSAAPGTSQPAATDEWGLDHSGAARRIGAAGLTVLDAEGAAEHIHTHLDVFVNGTRVPVPADIGFSFGADGKPNGISALHTHDTTGIVHIEAPTVGALYTLGQVLTEWGILDGTSKLPGTSHGGTDGWTVYVNGNRQNRDVRGVVLEAHDEIVLTFGQAPAPVTATYEFPTGY